MIDSDREEPCAAPAVPAGMAPDVAGYAWARDTIGEAGAAVYRLSGKPGAPDLYLKHGRDAVADAIAEEMARLRWLAGRLPVPRLVRFDCTADEAWLLTTAITGRTAYQVLASDPAGRPAVVDALAVFLRRLHAIPVAACPFIGDHVHRLAIARARIDAGLVDAGDFDEERAGWTAEQVWEGLQGLVPFAADPVVAHGDCSLDNLIVERHAVVGSIDVGRAGVADRYQDLAILWNCLDEFGPAMQRRLFRAYGIATPDERKLRFHLMLDELF
ncbi:APH(3')-I family aminoglycoside O-phosphotransferase [Pleomorphomonas sp. JP5]|uniref:APH(3')-I family aminoglycoside O-phosphotransferase n=1 Tax=Pleomorphomonas sp. JP5 TaxID=2942998 RepID=UPI00204377BF|nr:APH(3')-I family aminoglycoside O-phosphotransferase [Pleomorphomonas sp. JP5]MCM5557520.1 APH(3')-I family aminoglycoside O-phosphotransferase [Pleomorphomonas sp. JP5]